MATIVATFVAMMGKEKNPTGVRINDEKLKFIMEKEGLKTIQKVVTFLVDKYWWEQKIGIVPTLELQKQTLPEEQKTETQKEERVDDFKIKTEEKIKATEAELEALPPVGSVAAQRRAFLKSQLSTLRGLLK